MKNNETLFLQTIKRTFEERCLKNPQYSVRSFARALGVSPATLSGIMNGHRLPSLQMIERISGGLGLTSKDILKMQKDSLGFEKQKADTKFKLLEQDVMATIADWYHLAILELMKTKGFKNDPDWIGKRLKIHPTQIRLAIERLIRIGILKTTSTGQLVDSTKGNTTHYENGKTSDAKKRYHLQLLELSKKSLIEDDVEIRDHSSMTMAIDKRDIQKAKRMLGKFRAEFSSELEQTKDPDEVYQLQIGFFPITKCK